MVSKVLRGNRCDHLQRTLWHWVCGKRLGDYLGFQQWWGGSKDACSYSHCPLVIWAESWFRVKMQVVENQCLGQQCSKVILRSMCGRVAPNQHCSTNQAAQSCTILRKKYFNSQRELLASRPPSYNRVPFKDLWKDFMRMSLGASWSIWLTPHPEKRSG